MPTAKQIRAAGSNDVGEWGSKDTSGAYDSPLNIAGEKVKVDELPPLGDGDRKVAGRGGEQTGLEQD